MSYCPYHKKVIPHKVNYPVDVESSVPPELRANDPNTSMPPPPVNGGLYGGKQSTKPWASIPVIPTATYMIHYNLRSANPPPGAIFQYPGGQRTGNNYTPMPGVVWYNDGSVGHDGLYKMKVIDDINN
jgi:hypothetical protein